MSTSCLSTVGPMDSVSEPSTGFVCWNVRGLGHPVERGGVFSHLGRLGAEIAFLQETHLRTKDVIKLKRGPIAQVYHSELNSKHRGAAILINKNVQFTLTKARGDRDGRFVIVQGRLYNIPVVLVSLYAPNWDNAQFFRELFGHIPDLGTHHLILGGDFNTVLVPSLDRSKVSTTSTSRSAAAIDAFCQSSGMIDP